MKRFAVILIIAVLALGCVFAATGDSKNSTDKQKFIVKTTIGKVYPVYQIKGTNDASGSATSSSEGTNEVEGILSTDGKSISINVELDHFGYVDNDTTKAKTDIRYKGAVTVKITAGELKNTYTESGATTSITADTDGHIYQSAAPTAGKFTGADTTNFDASDCAASTNNYATVTATYTNGKAVATGTSAVKIASGSFTWNIESLTAGDTYKADVTVTYTVE